MEPDSWCTKLDNKLNKPRFLFLRFLWRRLFFLTIRMESNSPKYNCKNKKNSKTNVKHIWSFKHFYSSLSKYIAKAKKTIAIHNPYINNNKLNFPVAIGPSTFSAKINLLISNRYLDILRCWRVVNFINAIISQIKVFVNITKNVEVRFIEPVVAKLALPVKTLKGEFQKILAVPISIIVCLKNPAYFDLIYVMVAAGFVSSPRDSLRKDGKT